MRFDEARVTVTISVVTAIVTGIVLISNTLSYWALAAGFVPARLAGLNLPNDFGVIVPVWLTPLTATLLHGGIAHIALNLVMLVYCGQQSERAVGAWGVGILYVVGAYAACLGQWALGPSSPVPMIGASGAISSVVAGYALLYGQRRARSFGPVPAGIAHVAWLAAAWIGIQFLFGVAGFGGGQIAIGAHIGGFLAGLLLTRPLLLWRYRDA